MLRINKYLFYYVCNKDIDVYNEIIEIIRQEYNTTIYKLTQTQNCQEVRFLIHKLVGIVSSCIDTNQECIYLCRCLLQIPKSTTDFTLYKSYIDLLTNLDRSTIGL